MRIRSDRRHHLLRAPADVWPVLTRVQDYQAWWPWLRRFDGQAFAAGERWACEIQPPLPYRLRFTLCLDQVEPGRSATASVTGDIVGTARIELSATSRGSELHLVSALEPSTRLLRMMSGFVRPVARFGHDWVIDTGLRQFESRAL